MILSEQMGQAELARRVSEALHCLGIGNTLRGRNYLAYMLMQVVPDPTQLNLITKNLYPETGNHFGVSNGSMERAARTAISVCWRGPGRDVLANMACLSLDKRPTVSEFLDIVADYIRRTS